MSNNYAAKSDTLLGLQRPTNYIYTNMQRWYKRVAVYSITPGHRRCSLMMVPIILLPTTTYTNRNSDSQPLFVGLLGLECQEGVLQKPIQNSDGGPRLGLSEYI
jgi:hypothetical protein